MENKNDVEDVKQPSVAGMMCTIDGDTFFSFTNNTWIGDSDASSNTSNDDTGLLNIIDINESIQGNSSIMPAIKRQVSCKHATNQWD